MSNLKIDTSANKIFFNLNLKGETDPIGFEVAYRILQNDSSATLIIDPINVSREWIGILIQDFGKISLSNKAKTIVEKLL